MVSGFVSHVPGDGLHLEADGVYEALKSELRSLLPRAISPANVLVNRSGPTEGTIEVTFVYCKDESAAHGARPSIMSRKASASSSLTSGTRSVGSPMVSRQSFFASGHSVTKGYHGWEGQRRRAFMAPHWRFRSSRPQARVVLVQRSFR